MDRLLACLVAALLFAGCASEKIAREGDRKFEARDFDGAAAAYSQALADDPGDREVATKLEAARKNAATVHSERAGRAADEGNLDRAIEEIGRSRTMDPGEARYVSEEKGYVALRKDVEAQVVRSRTMAPENATAALTPIERYKPTFPEIGIRLAEGRGATVRKLLASAETLGKAGEWAKSEALLHQAHDIAVKDVKLSELVKASRTNVRVLELLDQGYKLKTQEDLEGALDRFQTAAELRPDAGEAISAVKNTREALARKYAEKATESRGMGDAIEAYSWIAKAQKADPDSAEAAQIAAQVRKEASKELMVRATAAQKRNLTGLAWIRASQAKAINPGDPALDREMREIDAKLDRAMRPIVLVKGFRNATRQDGRQVSLAGETYRVLRAASRNNKLATVLDEDSYAIHLKDNPSFTPDIIVKATLERFDLIHHPLQTQAQAKEYDKRISFLDATGKTYIEGTEKRTYNYVVATKHVTGVALLSYEIYDVEGRKALASDTVRGDLNRQDTVVAGNREAGVADDPDEMPANETLAEELQGQLRDRLSEKMRSELGWFGSKYYTAYEQSRDNGDLDAAVSYAVIAIRSLQAADRPLVAADLEFVLRRTGWSLKDGKLVPDQLR